MFSCTSAMINSNARRRMEGSLSRRQLRMVVRWRSTASSLMEVISKSSESDTKRMSGSLFWRKEPRMLVASRMCDEDTSSDISTRTHS